MLVIDSIVEVLLHVKGTILRLSGRVRYIARPARVGIEFLDASPRKREQIEELIADLLEMDKAAALEGLFTPARKPNTRSRR
jgi:hypothetical protein